MSQLPAFLRQHMGETQIDPRQASLDWFRQAKFGLFLHYGLYSLLAGEWQGKPQETKGGEWIQLIMDIPVQTYAKLQHQFTAEAFDADVICKTTIEAGMTYINLTTQHHDGFSLWNTATNDFSSWHAPAKRDLVAELSSACEKHGLALFLYYSHGRDWWHPDSPLNDGPSCRPNNPTDRQHFHWGEDYHLDTYLDMVLAQVKELCTYPCAGIWLDGIGTFANMENGTALSRCQELYDEIHAAAPHLLVSYKQGLTGTEDFFAPERSIQGMHRDVGSVDSTHPPYEICTTLQPRSWGYKTIDDGLHRNADWVMEELAKAQTIPANLLLNVGPKGDGSLPDEDIATLREVGQRLSQQQRE